jgi:nucleoside-diphosphate-sugar epimerase
VSADGLDVEILEKSIEPGIYNVADDEVISTIELIKLISESKNKKPRIWGIDKRLIINFAKLGNIIPFPLNTERLQKLTESYVVSNKKLKKALGIESMPVSAEEGMRETLISF